MKQRYSILVLFVLMLASGAVSFGSYRATEQLIEYDMSQALTMALAEQQSDVITQDTIRTFNNYLQIAELRGKAVIAVDTESSQFKAYAHCSEATIFSLSDQRPTAVMWMVTLLWAMFCFYSRRKDLVDAGCGIVYGGWRMADGGKENGTFFDAQGKRIKLTPMQQQLMEMFFRSGSHQLTKTEICDALWPKKPDASETLYTLIKRLKPVVEQHSDLKIESDRGRAYGLKMRKEV